MVRQVASNRHHHPWKAQDSQPSACLGAASESTAACLVHHSRVAFSLVTAQSRRLHGGWEEAAVRSHVFSSHLVKADDLPPGAANAEPDGNVEEGQEQAKLVPLGLRHIASSKVGRRRSDAVRGQASHQVG